MPRSQKVKFINANGYELSAILEMPADTQPVAYTVFAHVFTGNKSLTATRHIARGLTQNGVAVLRFDFTGLGESEGDFADTNFTSNVSDILAAAQYLEDNHEAPKILIGHSLGGAAVIFAASQLASLKAVATVGAPSEPEHVTHLIQDKIDVTLQMYARRKKWDLKSVSVHVDYAKRYVDDCKECTKAERKIESFNKVIELEGDLDEVQKARLLEIAERCPVNQTLQKTVEINSSLA